MLTITDKEFDEITLYIKRNFGIHIREEKRQMLLGRLKSILIQNNFSSFSEYLSYIRQDRSGDGVAMLINKITTNHTFFMREAEHFTYFQSTVLPFLYTMIKDKDLRVWCAGCSTGEESYTLAMLIDEFLGKEKSLWDTKILATDISTQVLEKASEGIYHREDISNLPSPWRVKHFHPYDNEKVKINDNLRNEVIFRSFNLMEQYFPFKRKFHVIFCRNVMIYFDTKTRSELVNKFYEQLEYGGYLFIGHSETINREESKFRYIKPAIYRKE